MTEIHRSGERDPNEAWQKVGEAISRAGELYLSELTAYLDWVRDVQREILEQSLRTTERLSRLEEKHLAFLARLRESVPPIGAMPNGTETVVGMVDAVVREVGGAD